MMVQDRWIKVVVSILNNLVYIIVSNSKINEIVQNDTDYLSTRRGYKKKGNGVDTMRAVVRRYHGDVDFVYNIDDFRCTIWLIRR